MRPAFVVIPSLVGDDAPGLGQVLKPVDVPTFLAQLAVETLHVAIQRWLTGLRMNQVVLAPGQKVPTGQLPARCRSESIAVSRAR